MKQLTLEISERQEQEELSEALQQLQRVTLGEFEIESCFSKNANVSSMCVRSCQSISLFFLMFILMAKDFAQVI